MLSEMYTKFYWQSQFNFLFGKCNLFEVRSILDYF